MDKVHVMITPKETSLVRGVASEVYSVYCPAREAGEITKDDLYHYGIIGLLEAKQKYDRSKEVPWLAFAAYRVRGAMLDQFRQQPIIRLPQARQKKVKELKEARKEFAQKGASTDAETLAERLEWSVEEVHKVASLTPSLMPVDADRREGEEGLKFRGVVLTGDGDDPETAALRKEMAALVNRCLEALPSPQDRLVIVSRVLEGLKLREVAETLGCSLENVRQWQKRVEKMMKACMERHGWSMEG
ncbi:MAG: sigma-70 family RNA polymerase sigma factor [Deltaproteobacteria bacterium]|nr:sigma-70 family RNA polymerase sigma factor [Deltaproteobacteria bacterium]